uniref:Peptidyl-prolyl cis-trans isomerase CWC27 homolog n=1 Tax=Naja naja TaxID=35670 RepID=A0A8C7DUH8_NAJNA
MKGKSKSSHDLLKDDPHLSSVPAIDSDKGNESDNSDKDEEEGYYDEDDGLDNEEKNQMKKRVMEKLKKNTDVPVKKTTEGDQKQKSSRSEELRKEVRQLKRELIKAKQKKEENPSKVKEDQFEEEAAPNSIVAEYLEEKKKYEELRKQQSKKGTSREEQTLALLDRFKSKLNQAISETPEVEVPEPEVENDEGWMSHVLHFEDKTRKVKDASMQDEDTFEIYDPRNPVNKRRREESKKILREKKARR